MALSKKFTHSAATEALRPRTVFVVVDSRGQIVGVYVNRESAQRAADSQSYYSTVREHTLEAE